MGKDDAMQKSMQCFSTAAVMMICNIPGDDDL